MKKIILLLVTALMIFPMTGCSKKAVAGEEEKVLPVKVMGVSQNQNPILLKYLGNTNSTDNIKLSFKLPGKIAELNVKEGDYVSAGQVIGKLDSKDYNFAVNGARGQLEAANGQMQAAQKQIAMAQAKVDAAKAQYDKALNGAQKEDINRARLAVKNAEDTYNYAQQSYERIEKLYAEGIVSKQQLDDIKIKRDSAKVDLDNKKELLTKAENGARDEDKQAALAGYNAAKAQLEAARAQYGAAQGMRNSARTQYESKQSMLDDTNLRASVSGYVVKVLNKSGENIAAGYPVVVIRTDDQVIDIQVAQNDIEKIKVDTKTDISINDIKTTGSIVEIEQVPDPKSRTYKAKIRMDKQVPKDKFYVGTVANVSIKLAEEKGIWLPVTVVLNDGEDYVYTVEKGRVARKNITISSIFGDKVLVKGVSVGEQVVTEGLKNIKPGYKVKIAK
ncbi:efflux RND transporter periplasmic adaptor subunit [Clostridium botulinum]|uniref:efflux RND transporter periplasmic adaptor subunit n=1 Tax=Clostridium botulinum TaxID=1491 RepID=UPI00052CF6FF|nr:efflux RND transporter periplasmic adaptor subunit [Clostridium botulinum]KGM93801.1 secretion protein HylD [Clostridium botulinum D str. CCUG 7971]NFO97472.1 efflux RND transporter periplasmic adaptor subunit [Clostridium botulinum]OOV53178.1 efflux transporter periplasmic adaptor subunit [Clostridium botulinum D/C]OOV57110.1 efflux transporter periplasmic adaptor subunit [Clostridium botulinum D/C]OOV57519.1 efflux transporter periplasmic adaptor subunit [Clostridium botulinum D/C]